MKKVCKELIEFFKEREGWDKDELLSDYCTEILEKAGAELPYADDVGLICGEKEFMDLQDFASALFDKIIDGVCNVIETA